jgi:hypothetical protein
VTYLDGSAFLEGPDSIQVEGFALLGVGAKAIFLQLSVDEAASKTLTLTLTLKSGLKMSMTSSTSSAASAASAYVSEPVPAVGVGRDIHDDERREESGGNVESGRDQPCQQAHVLEQRVPHKRKMTKLGRVC